MKSAKKIMACIAAVVLTMAMLVISASACSMVYVGSDLTEDGGTYFARSEDLSGGSSKLFYVSPAGLHKAGDVYTGCAGYTYTFTHDSYAYTAFRDDNVVSERCPDCGMTHEHTPYEEAGTNEKGVTVTSTVTLGANTAINKVDPKNPLKADGIRGIEEADINTVLLGEAATAKEALDLLMHIYDTVGTAGGNGIIISDQTEAYYIENTTGTQYIAIKLNPELAFVSPNISAMGLIDLDDPNVIASENLIAKAVEAGTFVGDEEANTIDFKASYSKSGANSRVVNGVNYLTGTDALTSETIQDSDFTISNVKDGAIVPFYTPFQLAHKMSTQDMVDFYKVDAIGNTGNLEYHVFQVYADAAPELATIEWVGMSHGAYGVMVPYYPAITTDTYAAYQLDTTKLTTVTEQPTEGAWYTATSRGNTVYRVLPENWADSFWWSFEAVSKRITSGLAGEENTALVKSTYADLQQKIYDTFEAEQANAEALVAHEQDVSDYVTASSAAMAKAAHETAVALYGTIANGDALAAVEMDAVEAPEVQHEAELQNAVDATCGADGYTGDQVCKFCGETLQAGEVISATGEHQWDEGKITTAPTAEAEGVKTYTCTVCGETKTEAVPKLVSFEDVAEDDYFAEAVNWAATSDPVITDGVDDTHFAPNSNCTREQAVTFLWRAAGCPEPTLTECPFDDVSEDSYAYKAILWAYEKQITDGVSDTAFDPTGECTRAQIVTFLFRANAGTAPENAKNPFEDVADDTWYTEAVLWAVENEITDGMSDTTFEPDTVCTRAHIVTFLYRADA